MAIKHGGDGEGAVFLDEGLNVVGILIRWAFAEDCAVPDFVLEVRMCCQFSESALLIVDDPLYLVDAVLQFERNR